MNWTAPATEHQRFFDELSGGDRRQLWARDGRLGEDADLVYLEVGAAPRFRSSRLVPRHMLCPMPGCPCPRFKTAKGGSKRDHFVHEFDPNLVLDHHGPQAAGIHAASLLAQWARGEGMRVERGGGSPPRPVHLSTTGAGRGPVNLVFVAEPLSQSAIRDVTGKAEKDRARICWFLWNRRPLLDRAGGRTPAVASWTKDAFSLARHGSVVWLSPDLRLVGIPNRIGRGLDPSTEVSVVPLLDCRLGERGPVSPDGIISPAAQGFPPEAAVSRTRAPSPTRVRALCRAARIHEIAVVTIHGWLAQELKNVLHDDVKVRHVAAPRFPDHLPAAARASNHPDVIGAALVESLGGADLAVMVDLPQSALEGVAHLSLPCAHCRVRNGGLDELLREVAGFAAARAERRRWDW
ncbi:hypothetical protein [Miltoncostaea oceani]|uniref:hypothetical protein n=1 Tax=Miltoncostaea oceani TaxID=2843216 RepID=UPI001C3C31CD|nr:hypothetical protein [Miltoncostaea oceani]